MKYPIRQFTTHRLVKSEDLNHHGTLFAGRGAEWFVESGFVAASYLLPPKSIICVKIHGLTFQKSVKAGECICYSSRIVHTGGSSLKAYVMVHKGDCQDLVVEGFITFVHVDENTIATPHGIELEPTSEEDVVLMERAKLLKNK
ncbi:MAG: hotdog domain-containing protein [Bacteroidota bacterium]